MGKSAKQRNAEQLRQLREQERMQALAKKNKEKKLATIIVVAIIAVIALAISITVLVMNLIKAPTMAELDFSERNITDFVETESVTDYVKLNVSYTAEDGSEKSEDIVLRLFSNVAPISVSNFQNYVKNGFYDGLVFHRIIENFMIQGGGYDASLKSKESDAPIKGEFSANGVENNLEHVRGVLSMARTDDMNSATSEFFIVHKTSSHLDGKYAGFGFVVYGMDTVDAIATQETNSNDQPMNTVTINSATFVKEK